MSNDIFEIKLKQFSEAFDVAKNSESITVLKDTYANFEVVREEIFEWIVSTFKDDEDRSKYLTDFAMYEHNLWVDSETRTLIGEIPIFDDETFFEDIEKMFDDYGSYFQRYGCLTPDQVVSWDKENVLIVDEYGNTEIVKRPDILLNIQ